MHGSLQQAVEVMKVIKGANLTETIIAQLNQMTLLTELDMPAHE